MLHQIRKMIGMAIAVVRGDADESVITDSWNTDRIDIPRAPGLGLMLEEVRKCPSCIFLYHQFAQIANNITMISLV